MSEHIILQELREFRKETNNKVDGLREDISRLDKNQAIMCKDIEFIKEEDAQQNRLLDEHIQGVKQVREQNLLNIKELASRLEKERSDWLLEKKELMKRIDKLEAPTKWVKGTLWLVGSLGAVIGVIFWTVRLFEMFK